MSSSPLARTTAVLALLGLSLLAACAPEKKPREASDQELAYTETDANGRPIKPQARPAPPPPASDGAAKPSRLKVVAPGELSETQAAPSADGLPAIDAEGPPITLIYVCEIRNNDRVRPAAVIFSCDPESPYMNERPRPSRILKPMRWGKVVHLLADLKKAGLGTLPAEEQKLDDPINGDRQLVVLQDGKRVVYRKSACKENRDLYLAFARCERVLITYSAGSDTFVETEGLGPIPGH